MGALLQYVPNTLASTGGVNINWSSMFSGVSSTVTEGITAVMPIAIGIFGAVLAISIGMKVFSKLAKRG